MHLSEAQRAQYHEQGYVLLPGLFDSATLDALDARFVEYATGARKPLPGMKVMKDIMVVKGAVQPQTALLGVNKMISFEDDPVLYGYAQDPRLLGLVKHLLGDDELYTVSTNVFNKPPGVDGRHPFHQDLRYFRLRPASGLVGTWTAMAPADRRTGCLAIIPGSHKGELLDHDDPDWEYVNAGFFGVDTEVDKRVHVEMQPGDTLLFHPLLVHGSGSNRGEHCRRAVSAHYAASSCESPREDNWRATKQARLVEAPS